MEKILLMRKTVSRHLGMGKFEKKMAIGFMTMTCMVFAGANIYFICGKLGITLAPGWYQDIVNYVAAGGTLVDAFAIFAGITLPAWIVPIIAGFGVVSA